MEEKIKLGISACLLGEKVRYDGTSKLDPFLAVTLGKYVEYVPVCPEVEFGLGVPREPMRLAGDPCDPRLVTTNTGRDYTEGMKRWARKRAAELESEGLCGFIFKSRSPSSGMARVKVYNEDGVPSNTGVGMFARAFMERFPLLPVEDEGRLQDPSLRENFIELVFTMKRWRNRLAAGRSRGGLVEFHTAHKLLVMSHSVEHYRRMGRLVAGAKAMRPDELYARYQEELIGAMRLKSTENKHVNVLMHILGYFKDVLAPDEKKELLEHMESYKSGHVPLIVPVTLVNHYVRKYREPYLLRQYYLHPHPIELKLRNHA